MKKKVKPSRISKILKAEPKRVKTFLLTDSFEKKYLVGTIAVLFSSTLLWSLLSSGVQSHNADQLIDPYLFKDRATFDSAIFPGQHTFLIKWPLFWLVRLLGYSGWAFASVTIATTLVTIGALAFLISRIERRPMFLGTLFLALSSMLLLIPAEPYAGAILPLNMAMLTTRNLEYVLYICAIYGLIKSSSLRSRGFWLWSLLLILVAASDKLFLTLSLGGALLALVVYALVSKWKLVDIAVRWLLASAVAVVGAGCLLALLVKVKVTHIVGIFGSGPYGLIHSLHDFILGSIYGGLGLLTNFGANPAYDANVLKHIPSQATSRIFGWEGPAMILNFLALVFGIYLVWRLIAASLGTKPIRKLRWDNYPKLGLVLVWSTIAALATFVLSRHYWAVDARYLTIALFAVFVNAAITLRQYRWESKTLAKAGALLVAAMLLALPGVIHTYASENKVQADVVNRNNDIAQILKHHKVDVLVGDYWRVVPIKQAGGSDQPIMPLDDCGVPRSGLTSSQWNYDLKKHSFAYLLTLRGNLTNFPSCTLDNTIKTYGRPNASVVVAGSQADPSELLLFYDQGVIKKSSTARPSSLSAILPIPLDQLPYTSCPNSTTIMNIVAHQDDDLLFLNPDTQNALKQGHCIRTVYVTAGDAGSDRFYWLNREQGSEAAYSQMLKSNALWVKRVVQLAPNQFVQISHPLNDYRVSLVFMHLPDGNITGNGFPRYLYESLARLESGRVSSMESVDGQSSYTLNQLTAAIVALMRTYQPVEIHTQANYISRQYADHSDHMAVGRLVKEAIVNYELEQFENSVQIPVTYYIGYPIHGMPPNVSGQALQEKLIDFFTYGKFDMSVCTNLEQCNKTPYGAYLTRQYQNQESL